MTQEDLMFPLAELDVAKYPERSSAPSKQQQQEGEWNQRCRQLKRLFSDWRESRINQKGLRSHRGQKTGPRCFDTAGVVVEAISNHRVRELEGVLSLDTCPEFSLVQSMKRLIEAEEIHHAVEMCKYNSTHRRLHFETNIEFFPSGRTRSHLLWYGLKVPGLQNRSPVILPSDYLILENIDISFVSQIHSIKDDQIRLPKDLLSKYGEHLRGPLSISFVSSGIPFMYCQMAIAELQMSDVLKNVVFESIGDPQNRVKLDMQSKREDLDARLAKLNQTQREAVVGMIRGECRPKPYILFGPPGTGKSHTLVEAVVQVFLRSQDESGYESDDSESSIYSRKVPARILVCVNSNSCTDIIFEKIHKELPTAKMLRLNAGCSSSGSEVHDIVVTTNVKAGGLKSRYEHKFDWIFVDEAGHANLPESLIPICCLKDDGCFVLAGDPKQLGPVVMCQEAGELGLNTSLLERLFKFGIYQRDPETRSYNSKYITMLRDCYRCDERILAASNRLFYHGDLRCVNATPKGFMRLMGLTSPVQLLHVDGTQTKPDWSTSWQNNEEIEACVRVVLALYKKGIEPEQIGIMTPYKLQSKEIHKRLSKALNEQLNLLNDRFLAYKYSQKRWSDEQMEALDTLDIASINDLDLPKNSLYEKVEGRGLDDEVVNHYVPFEMRNYPKDPVTLYERHRHVRDWMCKVDSIDAYQGNEKEIMIISTVRTEERVCRLEFLNDARRFNVAASRAKWLVVLIGNSEVLGLGNYWPHFRAEAESEIDNWLQSSPQLRHAELQPPSSKPKRSPDEQAKIRAKIERLKAQFYEQYDSNGPDTFWTS